jgi:AraC family transcriptional regulator, transcriptional activator of the genes for pyochelin and ferripyochelin receptors
MSFKLKNNGDQVFRQDFSADNFTGPGYHCDTFKIALPQGDVTATQWLFDGIRMSYSEAVFREEAELRWSGDTEMITMHFNLQGRVTIDHLEDGKAFELSGNQHNMFYGSSAEGKMKVEELQSKTFIIQLSTASFFRIADDGNDSIKRFADHVAGRRTAAFSEHNLDIDLPMLQCIRAVVQCPYGESLKRMFLLSKSIEMMVLQAESFDKANANKKKTLKTEYDKDRILFARDYLMSNMDKPPTLTELSRIAGLNEYKLKRGFKETFDKTVFQYLAETRLDIGRSQLLEGKKPVTEIAFELGYSSLQHFSAAFAKKFGMPPSKVK